MLIKKGMQKNRIPLQKGVI